MADTDFTVPDPVAISHWKAEFNGHEPRPRVRTVTEELPVYYVSGTDGATTTETKSGRRRARRPIKNADGLPLYFVEGDSGATTVNPYIENEDGTTTLRTSATETYTKTVTREEPVLDGEGNPEIQFATLTGHLVAVDATGREHPKRPAVGWDDLTESERDAIQAVFVSAFTRKCNALGIQHLSRKSAVDAGVLQG